MTQLWTIRDLEAATVGAATHAFAVTGVSIDTRTIQPGDLFVALKDVRDGHDFVATALAKGAAAAMVTHRPKEVPSDAPLLIVSDVLNGLTALGAAGRARSKAKVVAVTGSVGKTSTKEMLRMILAGQGTTHAAEASYNNHWGVPLTLARMPQDTEFAVIEVGMNHPGEIEPLARLTRPHVALITTIAAAHLEAFADLDGIATEKSALFKGLEPGGTAVVPLGLDQSPLMLNAAKAQGCRIVTFGTGPDADWQLKHISLSDRASAIRASRNGQDVLFKVMSPGRHFAMNGLGALAAAEALGLDLAIAATDLGHWTPPSGRGLRERILLDPVENLGFDLIDDAFNANPASLSAALDVLIAASPEDGCGRLDKGRRIAILGDMLELGPTEMDLHRAVAKHPNLSAISVIHCAGPRMRALYDSLPRSQRGEWAATAEALASRVRSLVDAGDIILVKGSKGAKVSLVVDALRKLGQSTAARGIER